MLAPQKAPSGSRSGLAHPVLPPTDGTQPPVACNEGSAGGGFGGPPGGGGGFGTPPGGGDFGGGGFGNPPGGGDGFGSPPGSGFGQPSGGNLESGGSSAGGEGSLDTLCLVSLIFGVLSVPVTCCCSCFAIPFPLIAVGTGIFGLRSVATANEPRKGKMLAYTGIGLGIACLLLFLILVGLNLAGTGLQGMDPGQLQDMLNSL